FYRFVGIVLLVALVFRLPWLGYKEFQGDEGIVLVRAAELITGYGETLFLHQKGPAEILLPVGPWALAGETTEFWVRLPFVAANLASIVALMGVAHRWFNRQVALYAGLLMACMGFHVAFGRIVQYQSIVVLMGSLSLLSATVYVQEERSFFLPLASFFLALGLLAHYDAVLFLPAVAGLILYQAAVSKKVPIGLWGITVLVGLIPLLIFYLPFALSPNFGDTLSYLLDDRVGTNSSGSLRDVWRMVTFYNSTYYIVGLIGLSLVALWKGGKSWVSSPKGISTLLLALLPLLFYTVIVTDPRTHVYMFFPGLILLAGYGIDQMLSAAGQSIRPIARGGVLIWLGICGLYLFLMFTDGPAERQRNWETARPQGYWTSWSTPPEFGLFGFPYQAGWRTVGPQIAEASEQKFRFAYASNEEFEITGWYTAQAPRTHCDHFDVFVLAENVQDAQPYNDEVIDQLTPQFVGMVESQVKIQRLSAEPASDGNILFEVSDAVLWRTPAEVARPRGGGLRSVDAQYGDLAALVGYDLDLSQASPGGEAVVTLYWRGLRPFERNFQAFVQLFDPQTSEVVAQFDTAPDCAVQPTTRWEPGQIVRDAHPVDLPTTLPSGTELQVLVGMYDLLTIERLPVNGDPGGALHLTDMLID
ncbi:MAG: glycosyltransferase family 39 protein, partial [Chloroflexota bacterium]